jgi:hypothetical protein
LTIGDDGGTNSASPPPAPTTFTALAAGDLTINGYDIGAVAAGTDALTQGTNVGRRDQCTDQQDRSDGNQSAALAP